jgi:CheY-like chemotaxis protein
LQPITSFLNGLECILEVITSWEPTHRSGTGRSHAASSSADSSDLNSSSASFLARARSNLNAIKKCVMGMKGTTSFMTMTINRCLDYTKTNAGVRLVPKLETVYLKALLEMPIKMMRELMVNRQIVLDTPGVDICTHIITDKQWLLENLLCLLSNAVKYSLKGSIEASVILLRADYTDTGKAGTETPLTPRGESREHVTGEYLRFEVQDAGIGLSDEAMQTLFNPFKQAQRMAGGTGLGLFSLAKRVEALRGQYGVCKRPDGGQGSVFWFSVPYRPDALTAALNSESSAASSTVISLSDESALDIQDTLEIGALTTSSLEHHNHPHLHHHQVSTAGGGTTSHPEHDGPPKYNVLVVDDAPLIVRMTTMLLSRKGHRVTTAVNGAEALERIVEGYAAEEEVLSCLPVLYYYQSTYERRCAVPGLALRRGADGPADADHGRATGDAAGARRGGSAAGCGVGGQG